MMENPGDFFLSRHRLALVFLTALEASLATHPPVSFGSSSYIEATLYVSGLDFPLPGMPGYDSSDCRFHSLISNGHILLRSFSFSN